MRRLLIIGCGDVGSRLITLACARYRVYALTRDAVQCAALRTLGVTPIIGDLDKPQSLSAIAGIAHDVVHLAPPPSHGISDTRTAHLIAALVNRRKNKNSLVSLPQHFVYISTSGVYGDCAGAVVLETRPPRPQTARAQRRVDAERRLRAWGARSGVRVSILRVPGIYAADRLPLARLARGTPALHDDEDSYVNHVHADDLARMVMSALAYALPGRTYNAADDLPQKMGAYFDLVADRHGLNRPPRIARSEAAHRIPENQLSFMRESRRLSNQRIKQELRFRLRYPSVLDGIPSMADTAGIAIMAASLDVMLVMTSLPDRETATKLAGALIEERVAACVSILNTCTSVYRWQGKVENAEEIPLLIKTTGVRYAALEAVIRRLHPYELPEIIAVPTVQGLPGYLQWVADETREV